MREMNQEQMQGVTHDRGPCIVAAPPGSGKTTVICERLAYLIAQCGRRPEEILVITFTREAAKEMQQRFQKSVLGICPVTFGTFHSIFYSIIRYAYPFENHKILTNQEKTEYMLTLLDRFFPKTEYDKSIADALLHWMGNRKNGIKTEESPCSVLTKEQCILLEQEYRDLLKTIHKMDFDDMMTDCLELLQSRNDILEQYRSRWKDILIDEVQDINAVQYQIVQLLASPLDNLFVVGDDDQAIYGFRGADPSFMIGFTKDYPGAKMVSLTANYRSTPQIVAASQSIIKENTVRIHKKMEAVSNAGDAVRIEKFQSREKESEAVCRFIQKRQEKYPDQSNAVILRTNRQVSAICAILIKNGIPFYCKEKVVCFFDQPVCLDLLAYFRLTVKKGRRGDLLRIRNKPDRGIKREYLLEAPDACDGQLKEWIRQNLKDLSCELDRVGTLRPYAALVYLLKKMGYGSCLLTEEEKEQFDEFLNMTDGYEKIQDFLEFADHCSKEWNSKSQVKHEQTKNAIITMHASKGLEFDAVWLPSIKEGVIPHKKSISKEAVEEERRMFYVAMTRAKTKLIISYDTGTEEKPEAPSRFLNPVIPR